MQLERRLDTVRLLGDFQGTSIINYAAATVPYTRVVEHKHFAFQKSDRTVVTYEYPQRYIAGRDAFYPIRDSANVERYRRYQQLAQNSQFVIGGRLGCYQYFDMHQVVGQALAVADRALGRRNVTCRAA